VFEMIMKQMMVLLLPLLMASCSRRDKVEVYAWLGGRNSTPEQELREYFNDLKGKGVEGILYNGGHSPEAYHRVGAIARAVGLGFEAWIPTLVQAKSEMIDSSWYGVNGLGESALVKPAYVPYYTFLCPSREEVFEYLERLYSAVAEVPEVDGIHLDYIRFPDVILARGLWEKYGLVMDREYPQFDYCYCNKCVNDFKTLTGIDVKSVEDPSQVEAWKQFRYNTITRLVNRLADSVHARKKRITAAVFPGPNSVAKRIVRQEWDKWNLDAVFPMNYNDFYLEGTRWIGEVTREGVEALDGRFPLYSGLFICPNPQKRSSEKDPENHGLLPGELEEAIRESVRNGAKGICLFTPERMTQEHWEALKRAIRR